MDDYLDDYEPLTAPMQFRVGRTERGRGLFATEALPSGEDILEEVPLVAWLLPATGKGEDTDAMACDVCLSVFPRESINLQCSDATCGARFCSEECATGSAHKALCGGALPALRARKAGEHGESLARCNLRIAQDVASFASSYGLEAPVALLNALRPFERLCTCPPDREPPWYRRLCLTDAAGEALAESLRAQTLGGLERLLGEQLPAEEARAVAEELTSPPHVIGLLQRLQLNTLPWGHPSGGGALRFGGLFLLASNANHACDPNLQAVPTWAAEGGVETFSLVLRTAGGGAAGGDELRRCYVEGELALEKRRTQLSHWGFYCECERCQAEEAQAAEAAKAGEPRATPPAAAAAAATAVVEARAATLLTTSGKKRKAPPPAAAPEEPEEQTEPPAPELVTRLRPERQPEIARRVAAAGAQRTGDWRYSVLPAVLPAEAVLRLSTDFFSTTELLEKEGNTFGPDFEQHYVGHKNYFYYINRQRVVPGAEKAAFIFEALDQYTRQVVELHHPGVPVRLDRAFGAYYEGGRDGFHLGVNEHCDGGANLVSTIVHAVLPDGDVGFSTGGELTVSETSGHAAAPIPHSNATVGSVVYLGSSVFHHASPINAGGKRLVFCLFYAGEGDLSKHALA